MNERHTVIPSALLVLRRQNGVFLMRRANTGFQDGQYTLPSGHVEKGEPPTVAVCREALQEIGVTVYPRNLILEQVLYRRGYNPSGKGFVSGPEKVDFFFSTHIWKGEPRNGESDKCDDLGWYSLDALPDNTYPVVRRFLKAYSTASHMAFEEAGYE